MVWFFCNESWGPKILCLSLSNFKSSRSSCVPYRASPLLGPGQDFWSASPERTDLPIQTYPDTSKDTMDTANAKQIAGLGNEVSESDESEEREDAISETSSFKASTSAVRTSTSSELACISCSEGGSQRFGAWSQERLGALCGASSACRTATLRYTH